MSKKNDRIVFRTKDRNWANKKTVLVKHLHYILLKKKLQGKC